MVLRRVWVAPAISSGFIIGGAPFQKWWWWWVEVVGDGGGDGGGEVAGENNE
jgi:hypothetical protein